MSLGMPYSVFSSVSPKTNLNGARASAAHWWTGQDGRDALDSVIVKALPWRQLNAGL